MKSIILSIATMLMMGFSAFAGNNNDNVNQQTKQSFQKDFSTARNISYEQKTDYVKVTFTINEQVLFAYYDNEGHLQAVVRNIVSDQLPINLLTELKKNFGEYWITDLFEVASDDQTVYYVTVEDKDRKVVLKSVGTSSWDTFSKTKKDVEL